MIDAETQRDLLGLERLLNDPEARDEAGPGIVSWAEAVRRQLLATLLELGELQELLERTPE